MAFAVVVVALSGLGLAVSNALVVAVGFAVLGFGVLAGHAFPVVDDWFKNISGWIAALIVVTIYVMIVGIIAAVSKTVLPFEPAPYLGLVVVGLDWKRADRLRPSVFLSGLFLVPLVGVKTPAALAIALVWFASALATLWVLQGDTERGQRRAVPVQRSGFTRPDELPLRGSELLRILGIAALASLGLAVLVGNPSCAGSSSTRGSYAYSGGYQSGSGGYRSGSGSGSGYSSREPSSDPRSNAPLIDPSRRDPSSPYFDPSQRDPDGDLYDPNDRTGSGGNPNARPGIPAQTLPPDPSGSASPSAATGTSGNDPNLTPLILILLGLGLLVAAVAIGMMIFRRLQGDEDELEDGEKRGLFRTRKKGPDRTWAKGTLARLTAEGERRGRPRRRAETIAHYCAALAGSVLPDHRIYGVGTVLDSALYGPSEPTAEDKAWVESVLDDVLAQHPPGAAGPPQPAGVA